MRGIVLTGFVCNGKTSMLKSIAYHFKSLFPDHSIIMVHEPVRYFMEEADEILKFNVANTLSFEQRQSVFIANSLAQLDIIEQIIRDNREKSIIVFDRCIMDVLAFSFIDRELSEETINEIREFLFDRFYWADPFEWFYCYIKLPQNPEILEKCFEDKVRESTLDLHEIYEKEKKFKNVYVDLVGRSFNEYEHPADNPATVYEIIDDVYNWAVSWRFG